MSVQEVPKIALKPLEIRQEAFPRLRRATSLFLATAAVSTFFAAAGATTALVIGAEVSIIAVGTASGVVGLVMGVFIARLLLRREPTPLQHYRIATLDQIEKDQPVFKEEIAKVKELFLRVTQDETLVLHWGAEHHALHDWTTKISISDAMKQREGLKAVWEKFLQKSFGIKLYYPQGYESQLVFSMEFGRLGGGQVALATEWVHLDPKKAVFEKTISEIIALQLDADGWACTRDDFRRRLANNNHFLFIRSRTRELLGLLWYEKQKEKGISKVDIHYLARRSDAAQLKIGTKLLQRFFDRSVPPDDEVTLFVRAHNEPAKHLYEKFGFTVVKTEAGYYSHPKEDALIMKRSKRQAEAVAV